MISFYTFTVPNLCTSPHTYHPGEGQVRNPGDGQLFHRGHGD
jgi:hypothetical protein